MGYVDIEKLEPGMILNEDVLHPNYRLPLAKKGVLLTDELISKFSCLGISVVNIQHSHQIAEQIVEETTLVLKDIFDNLNFVSQKDYNRLLPCVNKIVLLIQDFGRELIDELFLLWNVDQYTFHHSIGTAFYSALIAQELGYSDKKIKDLALGAILHDIGKGVISPDILNKPGMLEPLEFLEMQKHCTLGYKILSETSNFSEEIKLIPLQHHERIDGTGYPNQLKDKEIHDYSKIVSIADSFSALTTDRIYRNRVSKFVAAEYIQEATNGGLDKYFVNVFLYTLFGNLTDSWVELNNGEIAKILTLNYKKPMRPKVAIYLGDKFIRELDLAETRDLYIKDFYRKEKNL
jgi:putative nucleotidyltransferase with HDIG domain